MGFRFRQTIRVIPGVRINFSKGTPSLSIGGRGVTANISKRGVRGTVGLPGSGMSYSHLSPWKSNAPAKVPAPTKSILDAEVSDVLIGLAAILIFIAVVAVWIF